MNKCIVIFVSLIFIVSCVGPEEPLDGLSTNSPIVVNTGESFTFFLRAVNYSTEENYTLTFPIQNPIDLHTVLVVTDFAGKSSDTSYFDISNSNNILLKRHELKSNISIAPAENVDVDGIPNKIYFKADDFSGFVQLVLAIGD